MKHLILEAQCGIGEGGFACGPIDGPVVAEVKLKANDGKELFYCLAEMEGIPNFYETEESTFDAQIDSEIDDEMIDCMNEHFIDVPSYEDVFEDPESELYDIFRYLIYLVRCPQGDDEEFISQTTGKYLEEIEIPASDLEEEYNE